MSAIDILDMLRTELADHDCGWSIGSFGAIAEFHQDEGETIEVDDVGNLTRATSRGGIRIEPRRHVHPVAYEILSPRPHRWSQGIALCLAEPEAMRTQRKVLTELGQDADAIRPQDRDDILFDVGLDQPQIDFCIRTSDPELLSILRANTGKPTFMTEAGMAILKSHPHRVVTSALGRAEVYQKIGGPDTGGVSPPGPHTHVLPKLLAAKRTHSANTPIPPGLVPCAFVYPGNPVIDGMGNDRAFDAGKFDRFQALLEAYGLLEYLKIKQQAWNAIEANQEPSSMAEPSTRLGRIALRNALRQKARHAEAEGSTELVMRTAAWRAQFDKAPVEAEEETA